jgi:heterotetrameric sarcosine oxidase delta subunit
MGFKIECPTCGVERSYHEFWFGGELRDQNADSDEGEYAATWLRENASGIQVERWFHFAGCGRWLTVARDTRNNRIGEVARGLDITETRL